MKTKLFVLFLLSLFLFSCRSSINTPGAVIVKNEVTQPSPTSTAINTSTPTPTVIPSPTTTLTPTSTPRPNSYKVKVGDTLDQIAKLFDIPLDYLAQINNITDINLIYIGQILQIPAEYIPIPPTPIAPVPGKMIYVVLSEQKVYVYEESVLLKVFIVSSGVPGYDTVTGDYFIYSKLESTTMSGPGYYLEHVPYTMYFHLGYSFHGTYWHHNFGVPMSHGCLNMRTEDAKWLYAWSPIGTLVRIVP